MQTTFGPFDGSRSPLKAPHSTEYNDASPGWYLTLLDDVQDSGYQRHFSIKRLGEDADGVTALTAYCVLNALIFEPEKYSVQVPAEPRTRPLVWEIVFHAKQYRNIVAFLEDALQGVYFLSHINMGISTDSLEDDDAEMFITMRSCCSNPVVDDNDDCHEAQTSRLIDSFQSFVIEADGKSFLGDKADSKDSKRGVEQVRDNAQAKLSLLDDSTISRHHHHNARKGVMIGIDVDALSRSIAVLDTQSLSELVDGELIEITYPYDLTGFVRPLRHRLSCYEASFQYAHELVDGFHQMRRLSVACGADSQDDLESVADDADEKESFSKDDSGAKGPGNRKQLLSELEVQYANAKIKIVDLGNACWTYKHFTDDIQTRQYRSPEVIVASDYGTSADVWSLACIVFELLTGDLLFDPHSGKTWDRDEDHIAMIIELVGHFPKELYAGGKYADRYFTKKGELKHIHKLKPWRLVDVLRDKYMFSAEDSEGIADFLLPMLEVSVP
jgi:hypothetical protein